MDVMFPPAPHVSLSLPIEETTAVGEARRIALRLASHVRLGDGDAGRLAIVVTELATNVLQHASRGEILLRKWSSGGHDGVEAIAIDKGAGIRNVAEAMRDGFSTGGSSGLGLGAIGRLSTYSEIYSVPGKGTCVLARVGPAGAPPESERGVAWGTVCVPKRDEHDCGDGFAITENGTGVLVVDGLGHGTDAWEAARAAIRTFGSREREHPQAIVHAIHEALRSTRGAVALAIELDHGTRQARYAGVGNIAASVVPAEGKASGMMSYAGTLGHAVRSFREHHVAWPEGSLVVAHSDGVSSRFALDDYPGIMRRDPSVVAAVLYRDFASRRDDAVVVVGRERAGAGS